MKKLEAIEKGSAVKSVTNSGFQQIVPSPIASIYEEIVNHVPTKLNISIGVAKRTKLVEPIMTQANLDDRSITVTISKYKVTCKVR